VDVSCLPAIGEAEATLIVTGRRPIFKVTHQEAELGRGHDVYDCLVPPANFPTYDGELKPTTLTNERDPDRVKLNNLARNLGQTSAHAKVVIRTHVYRHTNSRPTALLGH